MIDLPTYNGNNWSFISRGEGSTSPVFSDEGIITTGIYTVHTYKQQADPTKKYNIYLYKSTIYGYISAGLSNNNTDTELPSGISSIMVNQSNGATSGINKITIYYDNNANLWKLLFNDDTTTTKNLTNNNVPRYITLLTQTTVGEEERILAITEEDIE